MVDPRKVKMLNELRELLKKYRTVAVFNFDGVPANLFREVRIKHRDKMKIKVAKKTLIRKALEEAGLQELTKYLDGQVGLVFSDLDGFKIYKILKSERARKPLAPGMVSPIDVVVPKGPTGLPPGPVLAELRAAGIPVKTGKGGIEVTEDTVVVRAGEVVKPEVANALAKLNICPLEAWLRVTAAYFDGTVFPAEVLDVDEEKVKADIAEAYRRALTLAVEIGYPTKESLEILLSRAHSHAYWLSVLAGFVTKENVEDVLRLAHSRAVTLYNLLFGRRSTEEKKEKEEEKKEEAKEESAEEEASSALAALFG